MSIDSGIDPNPQSPTPRFGLTEDEFCKSVGISRMTAFRWRQKGKLPHCRVGKRVIYLPHHVNEFLSKCERPAR